jgi:chromosome segregation ATPase
MKTLTILATLVACQAQTPANDALQALLAEVRQLRQALERSTLLGPRILIAVERVKMQQEITGRVQRELADVRREVERLDGELTRMSTGAKEAEAELPSVTDPVAKKEREARMHEFKGQLEAMQQRLTGARAREADLATRVRLEESNLDLVQEKLNQIERALDKVGP